MSYIENQEDVAWTGEERRKTRRVTDGPAHHGAVDLALLGFAAVLALAELAWLGFLAYVVARAIA
jgi:hypothetical protein